VAIRNSPFPQTQLAADASPLGGLQDRHKLGQFTFVLGPSDKPADAGDWPVRLLRRRVVKRRT